MTKRSIALAIRDAARPGAVLIVQRPANDEDLPNVWGLPAASLLAGESWEAAAVRAGRDKLGVELQIGRALNEGAMERPAYRLEMRVVEATIVAGELSVPQNVQGVTQYQAWRWGKDEDLLPAGERGSLCSRLYLERI